MRISRIRVNNFKSLVDFDLPVEKFTCLIGLNGSGKSTVLQCVDFLGQLMKGDMDQWFKDRGDWHSEQLTTAESGNELVHFHVVLADDAPAIIYEWVGVYDTVRSRCISEGLWADSGRHFLWTNPDSYSILPTEAEPASRINFKFQGSIVSQLVDEQLPDPVRRVRDFFRETHSLDTVTPDTLRKPATTANGSLGHGGRNLPAYLSELQPEVRDRIICYLRELYPSLNGLEVMAYNDGRKTLFAVERATSTATAGGVAVTTNRVRVPAAHINDGLLRVTAFFAELESKHDVILLDEIENGINPEIVEFLVDKLVNARQQVMVTTHSPMILNYLEDEVARKSVVYLYKTDAGHTKAIRFFDIPSMAEKLKVMGPGEVFVDTKLSALAEEIAALPKAGAP